GTPWLLPNEMKTFTRLLFPPLEEGNRSLAEVQGNSGLISKPSLIFTPHNPSEIGIGSPNASVQTTRVSFSLTNPTIATLFQLRACSRITASFLPPST